MYTLLDILPIAIFLLLVGIVLFFGFRRIRANRKVVARNKATRSKNLFKVELGLLDRLEIDLGGLLRSLEGQTSDDENVALEVKLTSFVAKLKELRGLLDQADLAIVDGSSTKTYNAIASTFDNQFQRVVVAQQEARELIGALKNIDSLIKESNRALSQATKNLTDVGKLVADIAAQGYWVQAATDQLQQAKAALDRAQVALTARRYQQAIDISVESGRFLSEAKTLANELPKQHAAAMAQYKSLCDQLVQVETQLLPDASRILALLRTKYVSYYVDQAAEQVTRCQNALAAVKLQEAAIKPMLDTKKLSWADAIEATDKQIIRLKSVVDGLVITVQTEFHLRSLVEQAANGVRRAQQSLESAWGFALNHIAQVEPLLHRLSAEEERVESLLVSMNAAPPRKIDDELREIAACYARLTALIKELQLIVGVKPGTKAKAIPLGPSSERAIA